jgi:hypothetical protein
MLPSARLGRPPSPSAWEGRLPKDDPLTRACPTFRVLIPQFPLFVLIPVKPDVHPITDCRMSWKDTLTEKSLEYDLPYQLYEPWICSELCGIVWYIATHQITRLRKDEA